jgi:hypothetical protein
MYAKICIRYLGRNVTTSRARKCLFVQTNRHIEVRRLPPPLNLMDAGEVGAVDCVATDAEHECPVEREEEEGGKIRRRALGGPCISS